MLSESRALKAGSWQCNNVLSRNPNGQGVRAGSACNPEWKRYLVLVMKATQFEYRHPLLVHQVIVATAFGTYLIQRDDTVWQLIKNSGEHRVLLERVLFAIATLMVGAAAVICTRFGRIRRPLRGRPDLMSSGKLPAISVWGDLLYAVGLGSLAPLPGFIILVGAELLRTCRLMGRNRELSRGGLLRSTAFSPDQTEWHASREGFAKWGIFLTMLVFTITLKDRVAEVLASSVFLVAIVLNFLPAVGKRGKRDFGEQRSD